MLMLSEMINTIDNRKVQIHVKFIQMAEELTRRCQFDEYLECNLQD